MASTIDPKFLLPAKRLDEAKAAVAQKSALGPSVDLDLTEKIAKELGGHTDDPDVIKGVDTARASYYITSIFDYLIRSGGLTPFFDSQGGVAHETIEALRFLGDNAGATILAEACSRWPDGIVPVDQDAREDWTAEVDEDEMFFKDLNQRYYAIENTWLGRVSYAVQHPELFFAI